MVKLNHLEKNECKHLITIIFSTHNGAETIGRMLESFCQLSRPPVDFEVLMINNACNDNTVAIAESFLSKLPLRILHQNKRGKNISLNYGIEYAKGNLLVFTDDDVLPDRDWLVHVWNCADVNKKIDLFGGRILPYWDDVPSDMFLNSVPISAAYGITPEDLLEGPVPAGAIWGANMFVRKRVFEKGFRFDESVGPGPGNYIMGSETEFNQRLESHGYLAWYCPTAVVRHIIQKHETTKKWLKKRAFKFGKGAHARNHERINKDQITTLMGLQLNFPRWMIRKFFSDWLLSIKHMLLKDETSEISHLWSSYYHLGYITQGWKTNKGQRG